MKSHGADKLHPIFIDSVKSELLAVAMKSRRWRAKRRVPSGVCLDDKACLSPYGYRRTDGVPAAAFIAAQPDILPAVRYSAAALGVVC